MACCLTAPSHYLISVDWSSVKPSDIHIKAISQEMPQPSIIKICLKITYLKFHSNFPGANELMVTSMTCPIVSICPCLLVLMLLFISGFPPTLPLFPLYFYSLTLHLQNFLNAKIWICSCIVHHSPMLNIQRFFGWPKDPDFIWSVSWQMMAWWCKEPGHQEPLYLA